MVIGREFRWFISNLQQFHDLYIKVIFCFFYSHAQGGHWTHVINLSGDDFITKPIEEITDILQREKGNSFIEILTDLEPKLLEHNRYNVKSCPGRYLKLRKHG